MLDTSKPTASRIHSEARATFSTPSGGILPAGCEGVDSSAGADSSAPLGILQDSIPLSESERETTRQRRFRLQRAIARLMPHERVAQCCRHIAPFALNADGERVANNSVKHLYSPEHKRSHLKGLKTCASVCMCPVCSAPITERRRAELFEALNESKRRGYTVVMVTYTLRHGFEDGCGELTDATIESHRWVVAHRRYRREVKKRFGLVGFVKALEVTYLTGWHPHIHELLIFNREVTEDEQAEILTIIKELWNDALAKHGRDASWEHGVNLTAQQGAVNTYVSKWGLEHELAKAPAKSSRGESGRTPFALADDYDHGDEQAGALVVEYANAFKGRRLLRWSPGLRAHFGLDDEKTDSEILAESTSEGDVTLIEYERPVWRQINRKNLHAEIMDTGDAGDPERLRAYLVEQGVNLNPDRSGADRSASAAQLVRESTSWRDQLVKAENVDRGDTGEEWDFDRWIRDYRRDLRQWRESDSERWESALRSYGAALTVGQFRNAIITRRGIPPRPGWRLVADHSTLRKLPTSATSATSATNGKPLQTAETTTTSASATNAPKSSPFADLRRHAAAAQRQRDDQRQRDQRDERPAPAARQESFAFKTPGRYE